jgi:hypothetical protein
VPDAFPSERRAPDETPPPPSFPPPPGSAAGPAYPEFDAAEIRPPAEPAMAPPPPSLAPPPLPTSPSTWSAPAAGPRGNWFTTTPPRTIILIGVALALGSCILLPADLPGYFDALLICAGPVGLVVAIVGLVLLLTRRPERRF